jgi:GT2 family glycosyltransferase
MALTTVPVAVSPEASRPPGRRRPRRTLQTPFLSAVIVNYRHWSGTADLARRFLESRSGRRGAVEVMVVDNHSPAHPLAARLRRRPGVSLRRWGANRGFARAVNEGQRLSRGRWLLLLNPDVTVTETFVESALRLAARLEVEEPRAGIVGFRLYNGDGSPQLSSGPFPTLLGTLAGLLRPRARRKYRPLSSRQPTQVPWVTGCCLLIRRDCLQELGGLDSSFFLYYEDVDLCRRARQHGWSVWYDPGLSAVHHSPLHSRAVPAHLRLVTRHALLTYAGKHWPAWQTRLLAGIVRVEAWVRGLWARWQGETEAARSFRTLGTVARALAGGNKEGARRLLRRAVQRREISLAP